MLGQQEGDTGGVIAAAVAEAASLTRPVVERLEAYLGWLVTLPEFLAERDALRTKWERATEHMDGIPQFRVDVYMLHTQIPADAGYTKDEIIADFTAFYERWQLSGLVTWDLPQPIGANIGCTADVGPSIGVDESPVVQLPSTLRLPARYPLREILSPALEPHLSDWQAVLDQRHPSKFNYGRWSRILHLHFLRNIALTSAYGERLRRCTNGIDWAFADYFGDESDESVRKARLWINRRLRRQ
jgi:hypothetical protein